MKFWNRLTKSDIIGILIFFTILILGIIKHIYDGNTRNEIKKNYEITIGSFERYDKVGGTGIPYITYSYQVDSITYINQVSGLVKYDYCYKNNDCKSKRFWVIYLKSDPEKSLIDLTNELFSTDRKYFPKKLDNFN